MLIFFCGKMGSGKTTLSKKITQETEGIRLSEDELLSQLYPQQITNLKEYQKYSDLIKPVVENIAQQLLRKNLTVVLDFPANTPSQRKWLKGISDQEKSSHLCYLLEVADEVCLNRLLKRANPLTDTKEMFDSLNKFFIQPKSDEDIVIKKVEFENYS